MLASGVLLTVFATRHFAGLRGGAIAVALFATMPLTWLAFGGGAPQLVLVPLLLAWLLCADVYLAGNRIIWLALAGAALAQMIYMHQAGLVMAPVANTFSRRVERQADDYGLTLTGNPGAFVGAMERLAGLNLAERRPHRLKEIVLYSHPALDRRIARARGEAA